jgi:hypothetical protein
MGKKADGGTDSGTAGGDLLSERVAVMHGGVKLSTLAFAVHPYPTLGEINKRVAGNLPGNEDILGQCQKGAQVLLHPERAGVRRRHPLKLDLQRFLGAPTPKAADRSYGRETE